MGQTLTAIDAALKDVYLGTIRSQLNKKTRILNDFTKADLSQFEFDGRQAIYSLHSGRSNAVKATSENSGLPSAGNQKTAKLTLPMRYWHGRIELSGQVIKQTKTNKGSFVRAMDLEMKGIIADLARQRNRGLFGAGRGILALINGAANSATQDVDSPGGVAGSVNGTRFLKAGMVVAIHDQAAPTTTIDGVATISSVTDSDTIVLGESVNADDNAFITLGTDSLSTDEGSLDLEPMGLLGLADSTTYQSTIFGLDRSLAANAFFRSRVLTSAGAWSTDLINRVVDDTEEVSGMPIDHFYAHYSVKREYLKTLEGDRRYATEAALRNPYANPAAAVGSKVDAQFAPGLNIKVDKDCPYGTLIGVNREVLAWLPFVEGEWADDDGAILARVANKDAWEAFYRLWENFFCVQGNALCRIDGITATVSTGIFAD